MGMFDTIKCEVTLPINKKLAKNFRNKDWTEVAFQTKDLDCTLSNYIIKKNKSFVLRIEKNEWIPRKKEKGIRGFFEEIRKDRWKSPYEIVHKGTSYRKIKHTGVIEFYSIEPDINENEWDLVFDAKFVDGVLISLKLKSAKLWQTADEVKKSNEHISKLMSDSYNNPANKVRRFLNKITFGYWRWSWNKVAGFFSNTGSKISRFILRYT
jgi:hypothetical protein